MARIRTIKPEFFTSEDIVSLSPIARLLYVALWCEADREGRLAWKPKVLKWKYLPGDDVDISTVAFELTNSGLVVVYEVEGITYAEIPSFKKHQSINQREAESRIPANGGVHVHARALPAKRMHSVSDDLRETVLARDGHKCVRCGSLERLEIDHIFPVSLGGTNAISNLRTLCKSCNASRPVAGDALAQDLALDGLSISDMQRICMHVHTGGEGKGREGKGVNLVASRQTRSASRFAEFWLAWPPSPRKVAKADCEKKWKSRGLDAVADQILDHLKAISATKQFQDFTPQPLTYLNQRRWEDGVQPDLPRTPQTSELFRGAL